MEEALTAKLLAHAGLSSLVGTRITWDTRKQGGTLPAVTLQVISSIPVQSDEGAALLTYFRVQIDCWAQDSATQAGSTIAKLVARQVMSALSSVSMTQSGLTFEAVFLENVQDTSEETPAVGVIYRRILDYSLWPEE